MKQRKRNDISISDAVAASTAARFSSSGGRVSIAWRVSPIILAITITFSWMLEHVVQWVWLDDASALRVGALSKATTAAASSARISLERRLHDPITNQTGARLTRGSLIPLQQLTQGNTVLECPKGHSLLSNVARPLADDAGRRSAAKDHHTNSNNTATRNFRWIPRIIHQTTKSRCVTSRVEQVARQWQTFDTFDYYIHDDDAVMRLLLQENFSEFPHLALIANRCLVHGTLKADLWRYLVLYVYGGIYADIDAVPAKFHPELSIAASDDAYFVVEQYHLLSQWFMAASPRHPLLFYAVQTCLANLLAAPDTGSVPAALRTGPHALHAAFMQFRRDVGASVAPAVPGNFPVAAGVYSGTHNRTVTVVGTAAQQNEYVIRDALGRRKRREYRSMGMRHFQDDQKHASGRSCLAALLEGFQ